MCRACGYKFCCHELRPDPDPAPAAAGALLPLLRPPAAAAGALPGMPEKKRSSRWAPAPNGWRSVRELLPGRPGRDPRRRRGAAGGRRGRHPRALRQRRHPGPDRHPDGGQGPPFPRVALAAVLFADSYLAFPDFRAVERTYSLLAQLAGRAGRGERPGKVLIQTFHPDHYAVRAALAHDDEGFAREELRFRRTFHYPPYSRLIQVLAEDRRAPAARRRSPPSPRPCTPTRPRARVHCLGPVPAPSNGWPASGASSCCCAARRRAGCAGWCSGALDGCPRPRGLSSRWTSIPRTSCSAPERASARGMSRLH